MCIFIYIFLSELKFLSHCIYVRKSREKKFLEKKPVIKTLEKKSKFYQVLGKNVTGNKVLCFGFLGLFPKIVWGAANKVSGKDPRKESPEENKSEEKKNLEL